MARPTAEARWRLVTRTPVLVATAAAWAGLVVLSLPSPGMARMHADGPGAGMTVLMVLAMMTPLALPVVRHVLGRSLRRGRARAVTLLLLAMLLTWLLGALFLLLLDPVPLLVVGAVVVLWQTSPWAQHCRNRHHALPAIAAFGAAADRDVLRLGVRHAAYCFAVCWDLMLLASKVPTGQLAVMVAVSAWTWTVALERPARPRWHLPLPRKTGRFLVGALRRPVAQSVG